MRGGCPHGLMAPWGPFMRIVRELPGFRKSKRRRVVELVALLWKAPAGHLTDMRRRSFRTAEAEGKVRGQFWSRGRSRLNSFGVERRLPVSQAGIIRCECSRNSREIIQTDDKSLTTYETEWSVGLV
jgi:hypothetical protein